MIKNKILILSAAISLLSTNIAYSNERLCKALIKKSQNAGGTIFVEDNGGKFVKMGDSINPKNSFYYVSTRTKNLGGVLVIKIGQNSQSTGSNDKVELHRKIGNAKIVEACKNDAGQLKRGSFNKLTKLRKAGNEVSIDAYEKHKLKVKRRGPDEVLLDAYHFHYKSGEKCDATDSRRGIAETWNLDQFSFTKIRTGPFLKDNAGLLRNLRRSFIRAANNLRGVSTGVAKNFKVKKVFVMPYDKTTSSSNVCIKITLNDLAEGADFVRINDLEDRTDNDSHFGDREWNIR